MGTEFVLLFVPAPIVIWAWCIWRLRKPESRVMASVLLAIGLLFMGYFCITWWLDGRFPFIQSWAVGSFLYSIVHILLWCMWTLAVSLYRAFWEKRLEN